MNLLNNCVDFYYKAFTHFGLESLFIYLGIFFILLGLFFYRRLLGIGSVKIYAELFNVKDGTIEIIGHGHVGGRYHPMYQRYIYGLKTPQYRYKYEGRFFIGTPSLFTNRASYNPLPGPCYIYINPKKPTHVYSPELKGVLHILAGMGLAFIILPFIIYCFLV